MAYIGKSVIGVEHPATSALTATSVTSTGAVSGTTGTFSGILKTDTIQTNAGKPILNSSGSILQVVSNFITSDFNTTSTSLVTTGLAQAITPSASSSKILCVVSIGAWYVATGGSANATIYRGSTNIGNGNNGLTAIYGTSGGYIPSTGQVLDSPATTSATTYTVYVKTSGHSTYLSYSTYGHFTLTLMEIAG
tara:strand:+ start:144 stop:722 length:579 start_codon:yes stop_codon:yes gene_type:complete